MTLPSLDSYLGAPVTEGSPNSPSSVNSFLDAPTLDSSEPKAEQHIIELPKGTIDPRVKLLSHSSRTTLHKCPKKYQLYRLKSRDSGEEDASTNITFSYGSAVGIGIQSVLEGKSESAWMLDMLKEWKVDLLAENPKQKKSIWEAIFAVQRFIAMQANGYLADYELVYYNGRPATELSFNIQLPNGFYYRGFVDVVLRQKVTKKILVLELKTASGTANASTYKNSGQAIGYSVILDKLFPDLSSYEVLYLVYCTASRDYTPFYFDKSLLQRALWLQELLIDCELIELYESYDSTYPLHGENCYDFFRECEYLGLCTLSTENLITPLTQEAVTAIDAGLKDFDFCVSFEELIESQLTR